MERGFLARRQEAWWQEDPLGVEPVKNDATERTEWTELAVPGAVARRWNDWLEESRGFPISF